MRKLTGLLLLGFFLSVCAPVWGQGNQNNFGSLNVSQFASDPSPCTNGMIWYNTTSNLYKFCPNGVTTSIVIGSGTLTPPVNINDATSGNFDLNLNNTSPATVSLGQGSPILTLNGAWWGLPNASSSTAGSVADTWQFLLLTPTASTIPTITNCTEASGLVTLALTGGSASLFNYWVLLAGLTTCTWLNGQAVRLSTSTSSQVTFYDPTGHADQTSHSDTGAFAYSTDILSITPTPGNVPNSTIAANTNFFTLRLPNSEHTATGHEATWSPLLSFVGYCNNGSTVVDNYQIQATWGPGVNPASELQIDLPSPLTCTGTRTIALDYRIGYGWQNAINSTIDTNLTRSAAGVVAVGTTATIGDTTGTLAATVVSQPESAGPSGVASSDLLYADSTKHTASVNNNNTGNMPISRSPCVNVTPVTVAANVTTDQLLMACSLNANALNAVGHTLKVYTAGVFSTAAASVAAITIKTKLCTVSGCGSGTVIGPISTTTGATAALTASNLSWSQTSYISTQTAGASSAYEAHGFMTIDLSATAATPDSVYQDTNTATVGTIDATGALFLQVTVAFSAGSTSNSVTDRLLVAELVN